MINHLVKVPQVCTIAMMVYPLPMRNHQQDMQTYNALSKYVERFFLIVWSTDRKVHVQHYRRIVGLYVPRQHSEGLSHLSFVPFAIQIAWSLHKRYGIRLFQASEPIGGGLAGAILKRITGGRLLVHMQGQFFNLPRTSFRPAKARLMSTIARWSCEKADLIRCISSAVAQECIENGIPHDKLHVVRSRCDTEWFSRERWMNSAQRLRRSLGLNDKQVIVTVGSLVASKGLIYFLEAMPSLVKKYPNLVWMIIGEGPFRPLLLKRAATLKINTHLILAGRIPFNSIPLYLCTADVSVLPSVDEGLGRALMEAMALEMPVIGSNVGGIPELIDNNVSGILVPPASPQALVDAVDQILADPIMALGMGKAARQKIVSQYGYEDGIRQYADLLGKLASLDGNSSAAATQAREDN